MHIYIVAVVIIIIIIIAPSTPSAYAPSSRTGRPQQRCNDMQMHLPPPVQLPHRWARMLRYHCTVAHNIIMRLRLGMRSARAWQRSCSSGPGAIYFFIFIIIRYTSYLHTHTHRHIHIHTNALAQYIVIIHKRLALRARVCNVYSASKGGNALDTTTTCVYILCFEKK